MLASVRLTRAVHAIAGTGLPSVLITRSEKRGADHDFDNVYDRVTVRDIADLLHHAAEMRCSARDGINNVIDVRHEVARSEWTRRKEGRRLVVSAA